MEGIRVVAKEAWMSGCTAGIVAAKDHRRYDLHGVGAFLIMCAQMQRCRKTMKNHPFKPENEPFPPQIEDSRIRATRTSLAGGNGICFADGML